MPDDELTADEKQALISHWLARGRPCLKFRNGNYIFNLEAFLLCTDPIVVEHCRRRARLLRHLLARWNNNRTEVPNESETTEVRPGEQKT